MGFGGATGYGDGGPDDDGDDDPDEEPRDRPRSSLPDPLDRVWLHPSELSPLAAATATRSKPMWTTTLLAGAAGAILTLAVLGAVGAIGGSSDKTPARVVPTSVPIMTAQALAVAVAHSVVAVSAHDEDGTKRRGSGVCVRKSGEILTSDRLVGAADKINVTTADGVVHEAPRRRPRLHDRSRSALPRFRSSRRIEPMDRMRPRRARRPAAASTQQPDAGDTVWVVGAPTPGDTSPWVSSGLVASTDSLVAVTDGPITSGLLETAAASNKASSGGALVDRAGNVTGIILAPVGDNRMTYAVPIATALSVANDFRAYGFTTHGALGINGVNASDGPTVTDAIAGGPAALAGIRAGDVVETIGKHAVDSMSDLVALVRHYQPGDVVKVEIQRGSKTLWVSARLDQHDLLGSCHSARSRRRLPLPGPARDHGTPNPSPGSIALTTTADRHELDDVDNELLNALQWDFPLEARPYAALGERLGISEPEVRARIAKVKEDGVLRQLSAIFDTRALGYVCAHRGQDRPRPDRRGRGDRERAPGRESQLQAQPRLQPLVHDRGSAGRRSTSTSTCCTARRARCSPASSPR